MFSLSRQFSLASIAGLLVFSLSLPVWAADGTIRGIRYDAGSRHIVIDTSGPVRANLNTVTVAGHQRVILDVDNAEIGTELPRDNQLLQQLSQQMPGFRNVTVNQYGGGNGRPIVRILFDINTDSRNIRLVRNQGPRLEVEVNDSALANQQPRVVQPAPRTVVQPLNPAPDTRISPERPMPQPAVTTTARSSERDQFLEDMKRTLAVLNKKYEAALQENQYLKSQLATPRQTGMPEDKAEIDRLRQVNRDLQNRMNQLESAGTSNPELDRLRQANRDLQNRLSQAESSAASNPEIDRLNRELRTLRGENERLKLQAAGSQNANLSPGELSQLRQQLTVAQQSLNESIRTINEQNKEIAYLRNQVSDVKSGMDASAREQISSLQSQNDQKAARIRDLEAQLAGKNVNAKTTVNSSEAATLRRQLDQMTTQYKSTVDDLNRQVQTLRTQASEADILEKELNAAKAQLKTAQAASIPTSELQKRDQQIASLQAEINRLKSQSKAPTQSAAVTAELTELKNELASLMRENERLKQAVPAPVTTSPADAERIRQLQSQVTSLETQLQSAKKAASEKPAASQPANVAALQKQVADLKKENGGLKDRLATASAQPVRKLSTNSEAQQDYVEAKAMHASGELEKSLDKYKEALLLEPDNSTFAIDYSMALAENHQYAEAIDVLRRYLQRNAGDRDAYNQLGKIYLLNDQADAASQAFTRSIPVSSLNNYATSLKKLGKMDDAESVFKLALQLNPNDSEVLFNLGNLYNAGNKLEQARNNYLQAIQLRPDFAEAHYNLGLIYSKMGDNKQAVTHLEKFLQLSPNARNAETIRAYVAKLKA